LKGYEIAVYEREKRPGGVLAALIPEFRLPHSVTESEIAMILKAGFEIKYGIEVGRNMAIDDVLGKHDLVFLATGAWLPVKLGVPGEDKALVGLNILRRAKEREDFDLGKVGVIGGGNTAFDIARCLRRMGNEVKIYYRRRLEDIPAEPENRIEAEEEGIEIIPLTTPIRINKNSMTMVKTECTDQGRLGELKMLAGTEYEVKVDNIVMAIGQKPDTGFLTGHAKTDDMNRVVTKNGRTSHPRIYAGGDMVLGAKTLAHAVGDGIRIAREIDLAVRGIPSFLRTIASNPFTPEGVRMLKLNNSGRLKIKHRSVAKRLLDFKPSEEPMPIENLRNEACRCLTCPVRYK
jgi:glutamate synthase (NADPH/NADH) small chain